jgi:hypothetical protein
MRAEDCCVLLARLRRRLPGTVSNELLDDRERLPAGDSAQRWFQDIRTMETFRDFELEFDWMLKADGNSGVKYLVQLRAK